VFQVESPGMRRTCLDFNIQSLEDIIALLALYRPGPMELIPEYIQRKKGLVSFEYHHPLLEEVSAETYGVLIYQEQVMKAAQVLAGYSMGGADLLRRAMSKKKKEEMDKQRAIFIKGAEEHNRIPQRQAEDIFGLLQKFADYGFNKSHSAAYGLVAYQTAYLKANYPVEFMAALLSNELDNTDKIALFVDEVQSLGIQVLPPSVNESALSFSVAPNAIRYGLAAIKNVGESAAGAIVRARESNGPFTSLEDFCRRVDYRSINKRSVESLIKSGAFDCISDNRAGLFARIDKALAAAQSIARDAEMGQTTLFMDDALFSPPAETQDAALADWPRLEKLAFEKELLGFYVTGHPIDDFEAELRSFRTTRLGELSDEEDRTAVRLAGMIVSKEVLIGKKDKRPWARIALEDRGGRGEIVVWSSTYEQTAGMLNIGAPLIVEGTIDRSQEAFPKVIANNAMDIDTACRQLVTGVHVRATRQGLEQDFCRRLLAIAKANRGDRILCVEAPGEKGGLAFIETSQDYYISCDRKILSALREAFGPKSVRCRVLPVNVQPPKRWDRNKSGNSNRKSQRDVSKKLAS
jgi:DNA polymerase-3 subunit alpha